jgi:hypothetical protein
MAVRELKETYLRNHRIEHEGASWRIDGKVWPPKGNRPGLFKVYRVHGDITSPHLVPGLQLFADTLGLQAVLA